MADHPSKEELSGFLLGKLAAESCEVVAEHVEQCSPCQQTIQTLESHEDTLLESLRQPSPLQDDGRSQEVVEKIAAIIPKTKDPPSGIQPDSVQPGNGPRTRVSPAKSNAPTRDGFERALLESGIIEEDEWTRLLNDVPAIAAAGDATALGQALVLEGVLTEFQATWLTEGKSGLRMGEYVLLGQIGAGGMGQVFKARHRRMDRIVALKVLSKSAIKSDEAVKRFQREVKAAAKLSHPNIVTAHDAGEQDGVHFLVMEYVEGQDLSDLIKQQGPVPFDRAISYLAQAARGLAFAHGKGVVHRDIKPANLLLDADGTVKILDLGLARLDGDPANLAALDGLTQSGQVMGTVDYMAPEQAFDTRTADAKADVYSLGCTLYRLVTGHSAFDGQTLVQKILAHRDHPIPSLTASRPETPASLDAIYQRMMAKQPADRPTMAEVVRELESLAQPAGISATSVVFETQNDGVSLNNVGGGHVPNADGGKRKVGSEIGTRPPVKWIAAAAAGFVMLAFCVWLIIRDKDGNEIARVKAPDGSSVTVQTAPPGATQSSPQASTPRGAGSFPSTQPAPAIAPFDAATAKQHQEAWAKHLGTTVETTNSVGAKIVLIPPGEFVMGSSDEQVAAALKAVKEFGDDQTTKDRIEGNERPQHRVVITKPYWMGATEVTIGQFKKFAAATGYQTEAEKLEAEVNAAPTPGQPPAQKHFETYLHPFYTVADDSPAATISWNDAVAYCNWLSEQERATCRLPTEAEWEFACRAGTTTQYSFGDSHADCSKYGWDKENSGGGPHPVATLLPNPFGLFDMHGNVHEWSQDYWDTTWYEKSSPNDPTGPSNGQSRAVRGNVWYFMPLTFRSASRHGTPPSTTYSNIGFRYVRETASLATTAGASPLSTVPVPGKITDISDPAFQQWMKDVTALSTEKQVEAVSKKLVELNPDFDGKINPLIQNDYVTELRLGNAAIADIRPLAVWQKMPLTLLDISQTKVSDLSPIKDFKLTAFSCIGTKVLSLSALQNMPLTELYCQQTLVSDLSPLKGMKLMQLDCGWTNIADLSPLQGMPLTGLRCGATKITDLSPLEGMKLKHLDFAYVSVSDLKPLQGMPLEGLNFQNTQVSDLSPLKGMPLTNLGFHSARVSDLAPLQGMPLKSLVCGGLKVLDLSPLAGMQLTQLHIDATQVSDLSPLKGMPLTQLDLRSTKVTDFSPLNDFPLELIGLDFKPERDTELLRSMKTLKTINFKPTAEFWKEVEKQPAEKKP